MAYKTLRYSRICVAIIIGVLSVLAFLISFYPLPIFDIQLIPALQRVLADFSLGALIIFLSVFLLTLIFGRLYCSTLCPFGLFQDLLMVIFRRSKSSKRNYSFKYLIAVVGFGALMGGTSLIIRWLDPYSLFGSAAGGASFGIAVSALAAILVWFKGRIFCTNICPVGTLLGLIAKHSALTININTNNCISCGLCASKCPTGSINFKAKTVNNETCIKCFRCLQKCPKNTIHYSPNPNSFISWVKNLLQRTTLRFHNLAKNDSLQNTTGQISQKAQEPLTGFKDQASFPPHIDTAETVQEALTASKNKTLRPCFDPMRRKFIIGGAALILFAGAFKGGINLSRKIITKFSTILLPPGAGNTQRFFDTCLNCNLCVNSCPMKIIKKASKEFPTVHLDYRQSFCAYNCHKCTQICPSGALKKLTLKQKQHVKLGSALIDTNICVQCGLCVYECPRQAIVKNDGEYPRINNANCIGCGACHSICPVQAVSIQAAHNQYLIEQ